MADRIKLEHNGSATDGAQLKYLYHCGYSEAQLLDLKDNIHTKEVEFPFSSSRKR